MKGKNNLVLALTLLGAGISAANAAGVPPLYGRLSLGYSVPVGTEYKGKGNDAKVDVKLKGNVIGAAAIGIQPDMGANRKFQPRYEFELAYRQYNAKSVNDLRVGTGKENNRGSKFSTITTMANAYLDFPTVPYVQPYVGIGIGAAFINQDIKYSPTSGATNTTTNPLSTIKNNDTVVAAQLMAGLSKQINEKVSLQADVKYLTALQFKGQRVTGTTKTNLEGGFGEASVNFGVRYKF